MYISYLLFLGTSPINSTVILTRTIPQDPCLYALPQSSHTLGFFILFRRPNLHFSSDSDSDSDSDIPPKLKHTGKNLFLFIYIYIYISSWTHGSRACYIYIYIYKCCDRWIMWTKQVSLVQIHSLYSDNHPLILYW